MPRAGDILFATHRRETGNGLISSTIRRRRCSLSYLIRIRPEHARFCRNTVVVFPKRWLLGIRVRRHYKWQPPQHEWLEARAVRVPFPKSKAEQRRLVARIEALTSRLEQARQARQARQAALAEAEKLAAEFHSGRREPPRRLRVLEERSRCCIAKEGRCPQRTNRKPTSASRVQRSLASPPSARATCRQTAST